MSETYIIGGILIAAIATYITRILPFIFFAKKEPSPFIKYIEWNMPLMIMVILVFYAIRDVKWSDYPYGLPEIIGIIVTVSLHVRYKNALLSIFTATMVYMFLVQKIFI